ncbi:MAG: flagellar hook-associated protein FlgK [Longimicrobiales bacterium]
MASLGSILSIAASALRAQQKAINVVSHNIANADTEGYTRQLPELRPWPALTTPQGIFGSGVRVANVTQVRDTLLDRSYLRELGQGTGERAVHGVLGQVEGLLAEPGDGGILSAANDFFSAFSELATRPDNDSARSALRESANHLADRFQRIGAGIDDVRVVTEQRLATAVDRVNELAEQIGRISGDIVADEVTGTVAGDLRDERRLLIDELGSLLPIHVEERADGSVGVTSNGLSLVDGPHFTGVELRSSGGTLGVGIVGRPGLLPQIGGSLGGLLRTVNTEIPEVVARLDALAAALITEVNTIHQSGTGPNGATGIDFFSGNSASSMAVSADIAADLGNIAAGTDSAGVYAAGAGDIALALAQLRDSADLGGLGQGFDGYHQETVTELGLKVRSADTSAQVHETLAESADTQRLSVSGVSTDEELVRMIQYQTGYQAAARVIQTAEELLDTLVNL